MKRPYQITAVAFIVFSAVMVREARDLEFYQSTGPGPGFFPFWISVILGLLAALWLYLSTFRPTDPMPADFFAARDSYLRIGSIVGAMGAAIVLMDPLGFRLTTLPFLIFLLHALGRQNLIVTALISLAGSFGVYHVFVEWLQVPLPVGVIGL